MTPSSEPADPAAWRAAAIRAFGLGWRALPPLRALAAALDAIDPAGQAAAAAALAAARPLLHDVAWVERCVREAVHQLAADPLFEPPLRPLAAGGVAGLELFRHSLLAISVERLEPPTGPPATIRFAGRSSLVRFVRPWHVTLALWEAEPAGADFSTTAAGRCRPAGRVSVGDAVPLPFDGARRAWTLDRAPAGALIVRAAARVGDCPVAVDYEAATGLLRGVAAADIVSTRLRMLARLARRLKRRDAAVPLAAAALGGPFHQRWHLARELVGIDRDAARPVLAHMAAEDPHPEVRHAASRTLARLAA